MAQRSQLALTQELEKLEQSITLTLQEIDHNFARAHRIVTTSILPIVDRYAKESEAVWEGSKFWKHFFETSANVSLSNYQEEEPTYTEDQTNLTDTTAQQTYAEESTYPASSPGHYTNQTGDFTQHAGESRAPPQTVPVHAHDDSDLDMDDSLLESLNLSGGAHQSTPQPQARTKWEPMDSPFEALKSDLRSVAPDSPSMLAPPPTTPRRRPPPQHSPDSSPLLPPTASARTPARTPGPIMHRTLDKTYRIAATPMGKPTAAARFTTPAAAATPSRPVFDSSPISSPPEPHLQTQMSFSPDLRPKAVTPKPKPVGRAAYAWNMDDDSSSDDSLLMPEGYSPPKTMQFTLPPGRLLATPAREASRRIVKDILRTAGDGEEESRTTVESSPPRAMDSDDDPF